MRAASIAALRVGPFGEQRLDDDRVHDLHDLVAVGVVGAELAALAGVEPALEQRAEDRGVDLATSRAGRRRAGRRCRRAPAAGLSSSSNSPPLNQSTRCEADVAARAHRGEQRAGVGGEARRVRAGGDQHRLNSLSGSRPTSSANMQKTRRLTKCATVSGGVAAVAQALGEGGERSAASAVSASRVFFGFSRSGSTKAARSRSRFAAVEEVVEHERVGLLHGVGPVGADHDAVHVGDDQQRRVLQRDRVVQQLGVGGVEVLVLALVLPGEGALAPDVGPALAAAGLGGALLEGEPVAGRVGGDRVGAVEEAAEVVEVGLRGRALLELDGAPLGDEGGGGQRPTLTQISSARSSRCRSRRRWRSAR